MVPIFCTRAALLPQYFYIVNLHSIQFQSKTTTLQSEVCTQSIRTQWLWLINLFHINLSLSCEILVKISRIIPMMPCSIILEIGIISSNKRRISRDTVRYGLDNTFHYVKERYKLRTQCQKSWINTWFMLFGTDGTCYIGPIWHVGTWNAYYRY